MLEEPKLGALAQLQLGAWEKIAATWELYDAGWHVRCKKCDGQVMRLADNQGIPYTYAPEQKLALIVAHLRRSHLDLDPDRG